MQSNKIGPTYKNEMCKLKMPSKLTTDVMHRLLNLNNYQKFHLKHTSNKSHGHLVKFKNFRGTVIREVCKKKISLLLHKIASKLALTS